MSNVLYNIFDIFSPLLVVCAMLCFIKFYNNNALNKSSWVFFMVSNFENFWRQIIQFDIHLCRGLIELNPISLIL